MSLYDVLNQAVNRYQAARAFAHAKARERGAEAEPPPAIEMKPGWRSLTVELVSVPCIMAELGKDQSIVSRRLKDRAIQPIYYDGKTPLYTPDVVDKLKSPPPAPRDEHAGRWMQTP